MGGKLETLAWLNTITAGILVHITDQLLDSCYPADTGVSLCLVPHKSKEPPAREPRHIGPTCTRSGGTVAPALQQPHLRVGTSVLPHPIDNAARGQGACHPGPPRANHLAASPIPGYPTCSCPDPAAADKLPQGGHMSGGHGWSGQSR